MTKYIILIFLFTVKIALSANFTADNFLAYQTMQCFDPADRTKKVTIQAPTLAASWTLTLPTTDGSANQCLQTNGSGVTTWADFQAPISLGAFGSSPNANGATLSANTLTLQPADATNPGGVTTGLQVFGGTKSFPDDIRVNYIRQINGDPTILLPNWILRDNNGYNVVRWNDNLLTDGNNLLSVNWVSRLLVNTSGTTILNWETGALTGTASGNELPLTFTSPLLRSTNTISCQVATGSVPGCLSAADWTTFNGKQASGNYITALTGDVTASGPGSAAATLATVNSNVGSFTNANITVNAKGLITAASSGSSGGSSAKYAINAQTGTTYTAALTDGANNGNNPLIQSTNASQASVTIPPNGTVAFPVGDKISILNSGSGPFSIVPGSGVTINTPTANSNNNYVTAVYPAWIDLVKTATNTWNMFTNATLTGTVTSATGGNSVTTDGNYKVYTFTSSGSWVPTCSGSCTIEYLVVGGGGGGGNTSNGSANSAGGGAGGGILFTTVPVSITSGATYTVTVGAGGAGATLGSPSPAGSTGGTSSISGTGVSPSAGGGGGGGSYNINTSGGNGAATNGSGGGASGAGPGAHGVGNGIGGNGGDGLDLGSPNRNGGGGGAYNVGGGNGTSNTGGNGAAGFNSSITGSTVCYAGGGGGTSAVTQGTATCGGAAGSRATAANNATANTGGGGGGLQEVSATAGNGGSGIVIIRARFQ